METWKVKSLSINNKFNENFSMFQNNYSFKWYHILLIDIGNINWIVLMNFYTCHSQFIKIFD